MDIFVYNNIILILLIQFVKPWDLSHIGITKYSIVHVSIFHNNAYLSIKDCEGTYNITCPALIEAPWPKISVYSAKPRVFPTPKFHIRKNCDLLQNVVSTDIDIFGRIWILDAGNIKCTGKLVIHNLYTQKLLYRYRFVDRNLKLSSLVIDKTQLLWNNIAYVGISNKNALFICPYKSKKCFLYYLRESSKLSNKIISTEELVYSKNDDAIFITSMKDVGLHVVYLETIRKQISMGRENTIINAHYIGEKLGPSRGLLIVDFLDILCYYLTRDYAIVCWQKKKPMMAETHKILAQSYEIYPNVQQLLLDGQNNMWAVNNPDEQFTNSIKYAFKKKMNSNYVNPKDLNNPACVKIIKFDNIINLYN